MRGPCALRHDAAGHHLSLAGQVQGRIIPSADIISLDAALWSRKLGPIEAECFADLANRTGVKIMALTN